MPMQRNMSCRKRKRSSSNRKKGFYKREIPYNNNKITFIKGGRVLPPILRTTLNYVEKVTLSIIVGSAAAYVYSGNGLYDPNITSTGAQPQMFDQLMTYYRLYSVLGSRIKITAISDSTTAAFDVYVAPTSNTTSTYNFVTSTTIPGVKWQTIGPSNSLSIAHITNYRRSDLQTGLTAGDDSIAGLVSSNPSTQWYWRIGVSPTNSASTASFLVFVTVELSYFTQFSNPNVVDQS